MMAIGLAVLLGAGCVSAEKRKAQIKARNDAFAQEVGARADYYSALGVPRKSAIANALNDMEKEQRERRMEGELRQQRTVNAFSNASRIWQDQQAINAYNQRTQAWQPQPTLYTPPQRSPSSYHLRPDYNGGYYATPGY